MDWTRGYTTSWRVRRVDPATWLPGEELDGVSSLTVKNEVGSNAPLLQSGEMSVTGLVEEGWYRIEALSTQGGAGSVGTVATLLFSSDGSEWSHRSWGGNATGKSVLALAADKKLEPGSYAPKGSDGAQWCVSMLRSCIPAPVRAAGSFELSNHVVFDLGSSCIDGVWAVLDAAGWCMQVDGLGEVTVMPKPTEPSLEITESNKGLLMPSFSRSLPISDVPNVLRVYEDDDEAECVNDDPDSPTSTAARGRRIEAVEENPTRVDGETLSAYARRKLAELSDVYETLDVEREYADGVRPYSLVRVRLAEPGVSGDFEVQSQTVTCMRGIKVGETLGRRSGWRA